MSPWSARRGRWIFARRPPADRRLRAREQDLKGKVKAAMVYPAVLAVLACAVLVFLLTFFIPKFSGISPNRGKLPWLTQVIVAVSQTVMKYGPFLAVALVIIIVGAKRAMTSRPASDSSSGCSCEFRLSAR